MSYSPLHIVIDLSKSPDKINVTLTHIKSQLNVIGYIEDVQFRMKGIGYDNSVFQTIIIECAHMKQSHRVKRILEPYTNHYNGR